MLKILTHLGHILYRIWFYLLVAIPILLFFPFLLLFSAKKAWYPQFYWLARNVWATTILYGMGCFPIVRRAQHLQKRQSYVLVANHTSMLDIMLMLRVSRKPFVFVGKKELVNIPVFGFFYKRVCILVDRQDSASRTGVYRRAQRVLDQGLAICIFPEGGVPDEAIVLDTFKDGAFKMAINYGIPIVPMVFPDGKKRFPFSFFKGMPGPLRAYVLPFKDTQGLSVVDVPNLRDSTRATILEELEQYT